MAVIASSIVTESRGGGHLGNSHGAFRLTFDWERCTWFDADTDTLSNNLAGKIRPEPNNCCPAGARPLRRLSIALDTHCNNWKINPAAGSPTNKSRQKHRTSLSISHRTALFVTCCKSIAIILGLLLPDRDTQDLSLLIQRSVCHEQFHILQLGPIIYYA